MQNNDNYIYYPMEKLLFHLESLVFVSEELFLDIKIDNVLCDDVFR